jgi:uncharacterized RDD family membrane protein YckC
MKCPKCHYITFDSGDRCRNCGYQFSLSAAQAPEADLPIQTGNEPEGPMSVPDLAPAVPLTESFDLPLFTPRGAPSDRPRVNAPAVPRAPLSVRKPAPAPRPPRKVADEEPRLDLAMSDVGVFHREETGPTNPVADGPVTASPAARIFAGLLDTLLLGAISGVVLHFTLKICRLEYSEIAALPVAPFVSFLLILCCGYVTAFTAAGGQSIGKMAAGIKVVPSDPDAWSDRVPLGQSVLRAVSYLVSALPAGLGFLPALIGSEKRALHDRLAHTRVVKA